MIDKKKIKQEYKNTIHPKGVFAFRNNRNGKVFLGSSLNLHGIEEKNKFMLNIGSHRNTQLQNDWKEYGEKSFTFEILQTLEPSKDIEYNFDEDLKILELIWIEKFRPFSENCYNENENIRTV